MSINLDNDMAVLNATAKQEHPQGVLMSWPHPNGGNPLQVVYAEFKAAQVSDWANRVRAFVQQVKSDAEIRARRDRELQAAEAETKREECCSPYCECDFGKCREGKLDRRAEALVQRPAPQPRPDAPVRRASELTDPITVLQEQFDDAVERRAEALVRRAQVEADVAAAEAMCRALDAAIRVLKQETGNDAERENRKTARASSKRARKVKTQKARVQGSVEGASDREA